jgi:hypothetical protein
MIPRFRKLSFQFGFQPFWELSPRGKVMRGFLVDEIIQNGYHSVLVILKWSATHEKNYRFIFSTKFSERNKIIDICVVIWHDI